uniref:Uncharacterized protein n=1 Tax=Romanomermis culicivorax TaxID=13658 RepID=A0A915L740_ROMCU
MMTPLTLSASAADEPPLYRESINLNERYVGWAEQQPHQNDLSFACDSTFIFMLSLPLFFACSFAWTPWEPPLCSSAPEPMVSRCDPIIVKL